MDGVDAREQALAGVEDLALAGVEDLALAGVEDLVAVGDTGMLTAPCGSEIH